jgi:hypothetical protein
VNAEQYASLLMDKGQLCERHQRAIQDWLGNPSRVIDQLKEEPQTASQRLLRAIYSFSFADDPKAREITQALREADDTLDLSDEDRAFDGSRKEPLPWDRDDTLPPDYDTARELRDEDSWRRSEREQER